MDIKHIGLAVIAVLLGFSGFLYGHQTVPQPTQPFGAISSPDLPGNYIGVGGVRKWSYSQPFAAATTTVCAVQSPAGTSTLQSAGAQFDVSSTTASTVTIAKATTAFATTTQIGTDYAIAAGARAFIMASTSPTGELIVFAPNTWFVIGMRGGTGTFSPSGSCHATFEAY
jgi:hypothetical protein